MPGLALHLPSPLIELADERLGGVRVLLKRDDLIHPTISGNKWRKLKYLLPEIPADMPVLTFGGAYSNHLRAVAAWGRWAGVPTIGVVRGDERPVNAVLTACRADGMRLTYLDRASYRHKTDTTVCQAALDDEIELEHTAGPIDLTEPGESPVAVFERDRVPILEIGVATRARIAVRAGVGAGRCARRSKPWHRRGRAGPDRQANRRAPR